MPRCLIIAGPNGAGKTTFARDFLPRDSLVRFINMDLIAAGLSLLDTLSPAGGLQLGV
jgi:predicted ABC-type ATPase